MSMSLPWGRDGRGPCEREVPQVEAAVALTGEPSPSRRGPGFPRHHQFPTARADGKESRDARVQTPRPRLCRAEPHVCSLEASSLSRAGVRGPAGLLTEPSGPRSGPELDALSPSDPSHIAQGPVF